MKKHTNIACDKSRFERATQENMTEADVLQTFLGMEHDQFKLLLPHVLFKTYQTNEKVFHHGDSRWLVLQNLDRCLKEARSHTLL